MRKAQLHCPHRHPPEQPNRPVLGRAIVFRRRGRASRRWHRSRSAARRSSVGRHAVRRPDDRRSPHPQPLIKPNRGDQHGPPHLVTGEADRQVGLGDHPDGDDAMIWVATVSKAESAAGDSSAERTAPIISRMAGPAPAPQPRENTRHGGGAAASGDASRRHTARRGAQRQGTQQGQRRRSPSRVPARAMAVGDDARQRHAGGLGLRQPARLRRRRRRWAVPAQNRLVKISSTRHRD